MGEDLANYARLGRNNFVLRNRGFLKRMALVAGCVFASITATAGPAEDAASPIYGVKIPAGYRDWKLISVNHEAGDYNQLRAQMGNDIAIKAYKEGTLPFPDGAIIVALHWKRVASDEDNKVFGKEQAFVAGARVNMQIMVKDSKKYAASGGWGFADFTEGKPADEAMHKACFPCHEPAKEHDFVYTRYAR